MGMKLRWGTELNSVRFGQWEDERAKDENMEEIVSSRATCYAYRADKGEKACQKKGITLDRTNGKLAKPTT